MGEEIEQHRSSARRNAVLAAIAGALVGGLIGFVAGGSSEKGGRVKDAAKGAALLEKDVRDAAKKMKDLDDALTEASTKLSNKAFPEDLGGVLGGLNVPFDATNFEGKYVGSLPSKVLRPLLSFTSAVQDVNKTKDSLKNLLEQTLTDRRWDMTYLGMQVLIEGLALAAFQRIRDSAKNNLAASVNAYVMQDEARHVHYGVVALREHITKELTESERTEREDWSFEVALLMRNRFMAYEVYEEWFEHKITRAQWRSFIERAPGMRWLELHPDGRIDTRVQRVQGVDLGFDRNSGGYL